MSDEAARFNRWLAAMQPRLCRACGEAIRDGMAGLSGPELEAANASVSELYADRIGEIYVPGGDSDYALPGVGPLYTGHWHGKRLCDALSVLCPLLPILKSRPRTIIDLGAGTGAALWAWTLLAVWKKAVGEPVPKHTWFSLDSSPSMLAQGDRLWSKLCQLLPSATDVVEREEPYLGDWRNHPPLPTDAIVFGSYLFSRLDIDASRSTAMQLVGVLLRLESIGVVLWSTANKRGIYNWIARSLIGWTDRSPSRLFESAIRGQMRGCLDMAHAAFAANGMQPDPEWERRMTWGAKPSHAVVLALLK